MNPWRSWLDRFGWLGLGAGPRRAAPSYGALRGPTKANGPTKKARQARRRSVRAARKRNRA